MRILISGEGRTELGDWRNSPPDRRRPHEIGVLEALISKLATSDWEIVAAITWSKIRKFRVRPHQGAEEQAVFGLAQAARDSQCDVVLFVRDHEARDVRRDEIERGLREAGLISQPIGIAGGVATQEIEAWILACMGHRRSEQHSDPKSVARALGIETTADKSAAVLAASLVESDLPSDARSLVTWLARARAVLGTTAAA